MAPGRLPSTTSILIFASFMDLIDATIVNVALPSMRDDLAATPAQLEWIVSAYLLARSGVELSRFIRCQHGDPALPWM
jgi:MFS family permease